ncbi:DUF1853 family protein [Maribacter sp. 2307ULW6-5]|uniref:DUF1853 family protein n=1 Tax=Maribacter sp. 2307ULW6-5 TaxID=3386275 RepID=UPI0039BD63ED
MGAKLFFENVNVLPLPLNRMSMAYRASQETGNQACCLPLPPMMDTNQHMLQLKGFLNTPALWKNTQFGLRQFQFPSVQLHRLVPEAIPQNIRLGHQMEHVFRQLLQTSKTHDILVHNLPIRRQKQTLGELDFILRERSTMELVHVELTFKFYIVNTAISEPVHRLMGPNKRDMFFTKVQKMKDQQFPLLRSPEAIAALKNLAGDPMGIRQEACFKAQLFMPFGQDPANIRPLRHAAIKGYWLRLHDFKGPYFKGARFYLPHKREWPIDPHLGVAWQGHYETLLEVNLHMLKKNAPMVWMLKANGDLEKFFVVWWP